ncbi:MAG: hypothetical protein Q8880_11565 [Bacteroidota bacterium]|nr:hypothetical protein [Bacteroidota bacterium]
MSKKNKDFKYIEELKERQDHQYQDYTGIKIPPFRKYSGIFFVRGVLYISFGVLIGFMIIYPIFFMTFNIDNIGGLVAASLLFGLYCISFILAGLRLIKNAKRKKLQK